MWNTQQTCKECSEHKECTVFLCRVCWPTIHNKDVWNAKKDQINVTRPKTNPHTASAQIKAKPQSKKAAARTAAAEESEGDADDESDEDHHLEQTKLAGKQAAKQAKLAEKEDAKQAKRAEKAATKQARLEEKAAAEQARLDEVEARRPPRANYDLNRNCLEPVRPVPVLDPVAVAKLWKGFGDNGYYDTAWAYTYPHNDTDPSSESESDSDGGWEYPVQTLQSTAQFHYVNHRLG